MGCGQGNWVGTIRRPFLAHQWMLHGRRRALLFGRSGSRVSDNGGWLSVDADAQNRVGSRDELQRTVSRRRYRDGAGPMGSGTGTFGKRG